jgi:hypothetical protein
MRAPLRNLRQPWLFVYYAVGFGAVSYLISHTSIGLAIFAGLLFAVLMSIWGERRRRRLAKQSDEWGPKPS